MAKKSLEPIGRRLYANNCTQAEIAEILSVSPATVSGWKADSGKRGEELDGWDLARQNKVARSMAAYEEYDRFFLHLRESNVLDADSALIDKISKLAANARNLRKAEREEEEWLFKLTQKPDTAVVDPARVFMDIVDFFLDEIKNDKQAFAVVSKVLPRVISSYKSRVLDAQK